MRAALALLFAGALSAAAAIPPGDSPPTADAGQRRVLSEQTGNVNLRNGDPVRVHLTQGDVRVRTTADGSVQYRLRIEGPASAAAAVPPRFQITGRVTADGALIAGRGLDANYSGHVWITLEVEVPRSTPLEVSTQGGAIEVQDIDGRLTCQTAGGRIRVGKVNNSARLETAGGDIVVQDVSGDLYANTGGGHILAGSVGGNANLSSAGGHIRVARVEGVARMDTGGGNIFLDRAGGRLVASTGGGRIMVGEVSGELEARSGGGGIRIWRVAGPARLQSAGGSIFLAGVTSPVRASTAAGGITARFARPATAPEIAPGAPEPPRAATMGEFECHGGDIVVFVPMDLGLTLDASVMGGEGFHILVDPALAFQLKTNATMDGPALRAEGAMAGGGPLLRLRADSGNILLRPVDSSPSGAGPGVPPVPPIVPVPPVPAFAPGGTNLDTSAAELEQSIARMQRDLELRQNELQSLATTQELRAMKLAAGAAQADRKRFAWDRGAGDSAASAGVDYNWSADQLTEVEDLRERVAAWFTDRVVLSAEELRPRLVRRVDPVYPEAARDSGVEGPVRLRLAIARDGTVEDVTVLSGNPELAGAAVAAVRRWRYRPTILDGKSVSVLTVLTVTFHRH
ncbi:MAG TPA: TonB family protein [Candidatus Binatia bacterium]|nr:TonB family protein [Candidatus Binatia bacterium]